MFYIQFSLTVETKHYVEQIETNCRKISVVFFIDIRLLEARYLLFTKSCIFSLFILAAINFQVRKCIYRGKPRRLRSPSQ